MKGIVDVRLFLNEFKGKRTVNGEAIIAVGNGEKLANDKRHEDIIIPAVGIVDYDTLVCLADDANRIDEVDSKDGITFYNVPAEFNHKKYDTKDEWYYEVKVHLGDDEFYANRCFFANRKQLHRLKKNNMLGMFTDCVKEDGDVTPEDVEPTNPEE